MKADHKEKDSVDEFFRTVVKQHFPSANEEQVKAIVRILTTRDCDDCRHQIPPYEPPMLLSSEWCNAYSDFCHNARGRCKCFDFGSNIYKSGMVGV